MNKWRLWPPSCSVGSLNSGAAIRSRSDHSHSEGTGIGGGMGDRFVGMVEIEGHGLVIVQPQQAGPDQPNQADGRFRRIHPRVSPSVTTIDALARALRLSKAEHVHLKALARDADRRAFVREIVPEALLRLVKCLNQPAYITGRRWDILAWNTAAEDIFAFGRLADEDRNSLVLVLTNPHTRRLFGAGWGDEARRMVAQFRATHDLWAGDPAFLELLECLRQGCAEFAGWWEAHDIKSVAGGRKLLKHPRKGLLRFEHASFQANDDPALKLVIYTPA